MTERRLSLVDLLHADVQGAEYEMLSGAEKALSEWRIGCLFISTHGCEHKRCVKRLVDRGYLIIASHSVLEGFSGDGLIGARAPNYPGPDGVDISIRHLGRLEKLRYHLACLRWRLSVSPE